jgi:hypothetical protein
MAITTGFTASLADAVLLDTYFDQIQTGGSGSSSFIQSDKNQNVVSTYVLVLTSGDIVYENQNGDPQFMQNVPTGIIPISATKILSSATVRGTSRITTADNMSWMADYKY